MVRPPGTLGEAVPFVINNYCDIAGDIIAARRFLGTSDGTGGGGNLDEVFYNFLCPVPPPPPGAPTAFDPPFSGGQCPVLYLVTTVIRNDPASGGSPIFGGGRARLYGPIGGVFLRFPTPLSYENVVRHTDGSDFNTQIESVIAGGTFSEGDEISLTSVTIDPEGRPNNCGDPPRVIPPYGDEYYSDDFEITVNAGGNTFNFPLNVTVNNISPSVNINGDLSVPITITFPDGTELDFDLDFEGDISYTGGNPPAPPSPNVPNVPPLPGGGGGGGGSCTPFNPPDAVPEDPTSVPPVGDGDVPEPEPTSVQSGIRGVLVVSTPVAPNAETEIFQDGGNPNIFAPAIGFVSFGIQVGTTFGWTTDIPVKNRRQFIPCPWEGGAIDVRGTPQTGWVFSLTPVIIEQEVEAPVEV